MANRLLITPSAHQHVETAYLYYLENVSVEVGDLFYEDVQLAYDALELNYFTKYVQSTTEPSR